MFSWCVSVCVCRCFAMATLTSSCRRSSSSYHSSARYSTSSSYRSEGSLGGSSDSLDPLFEPFLDSADHSSLFGEEGTGGPSCLAPFSRHSRTSYGHSGKGTDKSLYLISISYYCDIMKSQLLLVDAISSHESKYWLSVLFENGASS